MNNNIGLIIGIVLVAALAIGAFLYLAPDKQGGRVTDNDAASREAENSREETSAGETSASEPGNGVFAVKEATTLVENCANSIESMSLSGDGAAISGNPIAVFETSMGTFKAELYTERAPITACNFVKLIESGFFDGLIFHRVIYEIDRGDGTPPFKFVIQGGDPNCNQIAPGEQAAPGQGCGEGGSEENIPLEIIPELRHDDIGVLSMARTQDPNSATSQFFVTLGPLAFLDDNYAVFGKVFEGVEIVDAIGQVATNDADRPIENVVMQKVYLGM